MRIPPEGDLRWKAPRPLISPESKIQPQEGNGCLQEASIYAGIQGEGIVGQEDCLYLDIKAPVNKFKSKSSRNVLDTWWRQYIWSKRLL